MDSIPILLLVLQGWDRSRAVTSWNSSNLTNNCRALLHLTEKMLNQNDAASRCNVLSELLHFVALLDAALL